MQSPSSSLLANYHLAILVKGWPRLSETFVAQELVGLEARGLKFILVSLRHPTDIKRHALHDNVTAPVLYLPEYLHHEPWRLLRGFIHALRQGEFLKLIKLWLADFRRDPTRNRLRRLGQAMVLARECPQQLRHLYAHFLHTPSSVARYAACLLGLGWSASAHAKDIWTSPAWEKREKLAEAEFCVTCTAANAEHLSSLLPTARVHLVYHGLNGARLAQNAPAPRRRTGRDSSDPIQLASVGRLVTKKGYDDLLRALARLPQDLHWRFDHWGGGALKETLNIQAQHLGIAHRINWHGAANQNEVMAGLAQADLFLLMSRIDPDGDRDGLPNVLMEAQAMNAVCIASSVSAIPELIEHGVNGLMTPPQDDKAMAEAILTLASEPGRRAQMAEAARQGLDRFSFSANLDRLEALLRKAMAAP